MILYLIKSIKKIIDFDTLYFYKINNMVSYELEDEHLKYVIKDNCLRVYKDGLEVHCSKYTSDVEYIEEINKEIKVNDSIYIFNCVTKKEFRGQGVYKKALMNLISKYSKTKTIYICTLKSNLASKSTIENLGFELVGEVVFVKIIFIRFILNKEINDEEISIV